MHVVEIYRDGEHRSYLINGADDFEVMVRKEGFDEDLSQRLAPRNVPFSNVMLFIVQGEIASIDAYMKYWKGRAI